MRDFDALMKETLDAEERELLAQMGEEPGWFSQLFDLFKGKTGWTNVILMVVQTLAFIASVWAAIQFFQASTPLNAVQWGFVALALYLTALIVKLSLLPVLYTKRVLREVKLVQLQLAQKH